MDAYTQSEGLQLAEMGTSMSVVGVTTEDRQVQTDKFKRPNTSAIRKKRAPKTYNLIGSAAREPELLNGRRFIIYNKEEYETFKGSQRQEEDASIKSPIFLHSTN